MAQTTTLAELAAAISTMSFRDLQLFGEDLMNMLSDAQPSDGLTWAKLLSQWAEDAAEYEAKASAATKAA